MLTYTYNVIIYGMTLQQRRLLEIKKHKAKKVAQEIFLLENLGVLYGENQRVFNSKKEYLKEYLKDLNYKITRKCPFFKDTTNLGRALDVIKNGDKSRWYPYRQSTARAGSNNRGIKFYYDKYNNR